jgi:hypothetical protein
MTDTEFPSSWSDPRYVAAIVSVIATGALYFYSGLTQSGLTVEEITLVIFAILLPTSIAYEIARRL